MTDKIEADEEFAARIESELERYGLLIAQHRRELVRVNLRRAALATKIKGLRQTMANARLLLASLTGEALDGEDDAIDPEGNARHAVLCVLAEDDDLPKMEAKEVIAGVQARWDHTEAAIRSALVRAVADDDAQNIERGWYRIGFDAHQRYHNFMRPTGGDTPITDDDIPF